MCGELLCKTLYTEARVSLGKHKVQGLSLAEDKLINYWLFKCFRQLQLSSSLHQLGQRHRAHLVGDILSGHPDDGPDRVVVVSEPELDPEVGSDGRRRRLAPHPRDRRPPTARPATRRLGRVDGFGHLEQRDSRFHLCGIC